MFAVGITNAINADEIIGMSSDPKVENQTYWFSPTFSGLESIVEGIVDSACSPEPGECSSTPPARPNPVSARRLRLLARTR